jgi:phosphatidylinositol glycan class U
MTFKNNIIIIIIITFSAMLLIAIPLHLRLSKVPGNLVYIMLCIIHYFKYENSLSDLALIVTLLIVLQPDIIIRMKYLPWYGIGLLLPSLLSPLMLHLWIVTGTGNANYLFFQVILMLFIISSKNDYDQYNRVCY